MLRCCLGFLLCEGTIKIVFVFLELEEAEDAWDVDVYKIMMSIEMVDSKKPIPIAQMPKPKGVRLRGKWVRVDLRKSFFSAGNWLQSAMHRLRCWRQIFKQYLNEQ